jgi:hypothetical protein
MQEPAVGIGDGDRGQGLPNGMGQHLTVRTITACKGVLSCDRQRSIGDRSGAHGGNRAPTRSMASKEAAMACWEPEGCSQARKIFCQRSSD